MLGEARHAQHLGERPRLLERDRDLRPEILSSGVGAAPERLQGVERGLQPLVKSARDPLQLVHARAHALQGERPLPSSMRALVASSCAADADAAARRQGRPAEPRRRSLREHLCVGDGLQRGAPAEALVEPGQPPEGGHHGDLEAFEILGALPGAIHPRDVTLPAELVAALGILPIREEAEDQAGDAEIAARRALRRTLEQAYGKLRAAFPGQRDLVESFFPKQKGRAAKAEERKPKEG